jgi:DNA-binding transcriptional ArsR family regulator
MPSVYELQAELCQALGHAVRQETIHILQDGPKRVNDIAQLMGLPQSTISRHLAVLRSSGMITGQRQGSEVIYSITDPKIVDVCNLMREVLLEQVARSSELAQVMAHEK